MLTTLDIINKMLASTGTAPLTSSDTSHPLYIKASNALTVVNREVQGKGWWFNRAIRTMTPDVNGEIILPSTTLHADPVNTYTKLVMRGGKLYDLDNATLVISEDVKVDWIELVDIADLPPTAGEYIKARSVYEFFLDEDGKEPKLTRYERAMQQAWIKMKDDHLKNADVNWFNSLSQAQMARGVWHSRRRLPLYDE